MFLVFLVILYFILNSDVLNKVKIKITNMLTYFHESEENYIYICRKNVEEILEKEKLRFTTDFNYRILMIREFSNPFEAENWAKELVSLFENYRICRKEKFMNSSKIISVIYEVRFNSPYVYIDKFSGVFYCDENGNIIEKKCY